MGGAAILRNFGGGESRYKQKLVKISTPAHKGRLGMARGPRRRDANVCSWE